MRKNLILSICFCFKFACVDGPDFDGHLVDFDSAMRRGAMYKAQEKAAVARREEHCNLYKMEVK